MTPSEENKKYIDDWFKTSGYKRVSFTVALNRNVSQEACEAEFVEELKSIERDKLAGITTFRPIREFGPL